MSDSPIKDIDIEYYPTPKRVKIFTWCVFGFIIIGFIFLIIVFT